MPLKLILLFLTEIVTPLVVCSVSSSDVRLTLVDVLSKESFAIIFADAVSIAELTSFFVAKFEPAGSNFDLSLIAFSVTLTIKCCAVITAPLLSDSTSSHLVTPGKDKTLSVSSTTITLFDIVQF